MLIYVLYLSGENGDVLTHSTAFTNILNFDIIIKNIIRMVIYVCNIYNNFR